MSMVLYVTSVGWMPSERMSRSTRLPSACSPALTHAPSALLNTTADLYTQGVSHASSQRARAVAVPALP